ncbi:Uncharacterised protein [Phocoenobacter uteri]|uniref:Uncharacterized protein n=1 Tax=Phocoenobacter uteri TaxID=146806 RepID=A0A379C9V3_9PAST|nr:hypothetical protein [Phocoenobacter uteri]MDG6881078.1 hypothetical protein [Phocoenobacter uteri]SUB59100.1 Uncharacterised protein [Phocoenobacter uteri]
MTGQCKTVFATADGIYRIKEVNCGQFYALFVRGTFIDRFYRFSEAKKRMEALKKVAIHGRAC